MTRIAAAASSPLYRARLDSPLGALEAMAEDAGVLLLEFDEPRRLDLQRRRLRRYRNGAVRDAMHPLLERLREELTAYWAGRLHRFSVPLSLTGTDFQCEVWSALQQIPYGQTRAYEQLAAMLGRTNASRAIGAANGANRLALLIPCHRLIGKQGQLTGYGGGLWRKQRLLALEAGDPEAAREAAPAAVRPNAGRRPPAAPRR
ncbi:MAG TPA: methylated-DNA--[protein]-cysteine S-methyltransferase [Solimonas sp.]